MFERLPILERYEERLLDGSDPHARFWLYDDMADVLENYYGIMNMERRMAKNRELRGRSLWPPFDGSFWKEHDDCVWWLWEEVSNGFFLHHLTFNHEAKTMTHEQFEVVFYNDNGLTMAYVIHPQGILNIVEGRPLPPNHTETLEVQWDNDKEPTTMTFCALSSFHWFPVGTLHRCNTDIWHFQQYKDYLKVEKYPDSAYDLRTGIAAITPFAIFIPADITSYYRIPLSTNEALHKVCIDDPAGLMTFQESGRRFVTFTDLNLFFEVTTEKLCQTNGIRIVKNII